MLHKETILGRNAKVDELIRIALIKNFTWHEV